MRLAHHVLVFGQPGTVFPYLRSRGEVMALGFAKGANPGSGLTIMVPTTKRLRTLAVSCVNNKKRARRLKELVVLYH